MTDPSTTAVWLACGTAGAWTDVSTYLRVNEPISISPGRTSGFDDTAPQVISVTFDNSTGNFTPDNTSSAFATTLVEGMQICVQIDAELYAGKIRSHTPFFRSSLGSSAQMRVTFDDVLGELARNGLEDIPASLVLAASPYWWWPLSEAAGAIAASDQSGNNGPTLAAISTGALTYAKTPTFGVAGPTFTTATQASFFSDFSADYYGFGWTGTATTISYASGSMGVYGVRLTPTTANDYLQVQFTPAGLNKPVVLGVDMLNGVFFMSAGLTANVTAPAMVGTSRFLSVVLTTAGSTTITCTFYVDGVSQGSAVYTQTGAVGALTNTQRTPSTVGVGWIGGAGGSTTVYVQDIIHSPALVHEEYLQSTATEAAIISLLSAATLGVTLATLPAGLSTATTSLDSAASALSGINDAIRTEQGYIYSQTSGTVSAPVQSLVVKERVRSETVDYTFAVTEIDDAPELLRTLSNMVSSVNVNGPTQTVRVTDPTLNSRVGSANTSANVLTTGYSDLREWGQDRLIRGTPRAIPIVSFTINARLKGRWADLGAIRPSHRVQITGLPSQLGSSTFDGWVVGKGQSHTREYGLFTIYLDPALARTAVFDTDGFMADGVLSLTSTINASVTSLSCTSTGVLFTTAGGDLPTTIRIDNEVCTVSAVSAASSPQTFTIARGATDPMTGLATTAAAHTAGALIEIATPALFAF